MRRETESVAVIREKTSIESCRLLTSRCFGAFRDLPQKVDGAAAALLSGPVDAGS
ncbi:MAG: hypothetical protein JWL86_2120 [Rhizobium sp.]|nr:hypothetical protein [Rhizobium sp.]